MNGLGAYVATKKTFVGIDWLNLTSGAMKTAGGAFGGGGAGGGGDATAAAAAQARLEEQKRAAEQSASNWKMIGIVAGLVVLAGGFMLYKRAA